jgi:hypothetical protein
VVIVRGPGVEKCATRAQLLCLPFYLGDEILAERVSFAWGALSRGCHQHPYELPPTASELTASQLANELLSDGSTPVDDCSTDTPRSTPRGSRDN